MIIVNSQTYELCSDVIGLVLDLKAIYQVEPPKSLPEDSNSMAVIELDNDSILHFCYINSKLALVSIRRKDRFEKQGLIEHNFKMLAKAVIQVFND